MQSFFKKLPRYSLRLLLAYLVYIFTGGVLAYLLPRQARNLPQTDSFYGIGRAGPGRTGGGATRCVCTPRGSDPYRAEHTGRLLSLCQKRRDYGVLFRRTVEGGRPRRARTRSAGRHCGRPFRRAE